MNIDFGKWWIETKIRWNSESPFYFRTIQKVAFSVAAAITAGYGTAAALQFELGEPLKTILTHLAVGATMVGTFCKLTVKQPVETLDEKVEAENNSVIDNGSGMLREPKS